MSDEDIEVWIKLSEEMAVANHDRFHDLDMLEIGALLHIASEEDVDRLPLLIGAMSFINIDALAAHMIMTTGMWCYTCDKHGCSLEDAVGNRKVMDAMVGGISLVCAILMSRQIIHPGWAMVAHQTNIARQMPSRQSGKSIEERAVLIEAWYVEHKADRAGEVTCASDLVLASDLDLPVGEIKSSCEMLCEHGRLVRNRDLSDRPLYHPPMKNIKGFSVVIEAEFDELIDEMRKRMAPSDPVFPQYASLEQKLRRKPGKKSGGRSRKPKGKPDARG